MRVIITILVALILIETANGQNNSKTNSLDSDQFASHNSLNGFSIFLKYFKQDSVFQLSHIKFPLEKVISKENTEYKYILQNTTIKTNQWRYMNLKYDSTNAIRRINAYKEKYFIKNDTAHLTYKGVNNGINVEFIFTLINSNWFLIKWIDLSD
jgi:hypothetical protein